MVPDLPKTIYEEETLDPADWNELRELGHRMVDDMLTYLETVRERPLWRPMPPEVQQSFKTPLPADGVPAEEVYEDFRQNVMPYPMGNIHPRFWGWSWAMERPRVCWLICWLLVSTRIWAGATMRATVSRCRLSTGASRCSAIRARQAACSSAAAQWQTSCLPARNVKLRLRYTSEGTGGSVDTSQHTALGRDALVRHAKGHRVDGQGNRSLSGRSTTTTFA